MPRMAVGNLMIDLDVPSHMTCEYSASGSLMARTGSASIEISTVTVEGTSDGLALEHVQRRARAANRTVRTFPGPIVVLGEDSTWHAGLGNTVIVATLSNATEAPQFDVEAMLASAAPAHDAFDSRTEQYQFCALRPSQGAWFAQARASLRHAMAWEARGPIPLEELDAFWADLLDHPPDDESFTQLVLREIAVGFGDHLTRNGFKWCISSSPRGLAFSVVALPYAEHLLIAPETFVLKRWERKERNFFCDSAQTILRQLATTQRTWNSQRN